MNALIRPGPFGARAGDELPAGATRNDPPDSSDDSSGTTEEPASGDASGGANTIERDASGGGQTTGAPGNDGGAPAMECGAASAGICVTTKPVRLVPSDSSRDALSIAVDGDVAVIGTEGDDVDIDGSAYVFVRSGSTWSEQQKLLPSDDVARGSFGDSVAVSGDTIVVGTCRPGTGCGGSGSAYVYVREGLCLEPAAEAGPIGGRG